MTNAHQLFGAAFTFPDSDAQARYNALVGIDDIKEALCAEAAILLDSTVLERWSKTHHQQVIRASVEVGNRAPLIVLAGDVGTGKTELAETFADAVARRQKIDITVLPLSLSSRGKGAVGEMTTLITEAFSQVRQAAEKGRDGSGKVRRGVILFIDEADAIAQSRELAQMHHEDRAGVNALIRGVDQLRSERLPVLTIMCTNRVDSLDPAIARRAARVFTFDRPNETQRRQLLHTLLGDADIPTNDINELVELTGATGDRNYGCTYSDIRQRLIPQAVLTSVAQSAKLTGKTLIAIAQDFMPTRPFGASE